MLTSLTARCLPRLRQVQLENVRVGAEFLLALAFAAPQLEYINLAGSELSCHPAVVCAILAACCQHIERINISDEIIHSWSSPQAADVVAAYQSAVVAAGRGAGYVPFTRLTQLKLDMCWCAHSSVYYALLSLLRHATRLHCLSLIAISDPLAVAGLNALPSLTTFSADCSFPKSFTDCVQRRDEESSEYCYVSAGVLRQFKVTPVAKQLAILQLTEDRVVEKPPLVYARLRPRSQLFADYQRSLSAGQQAVLAKWEAGDYSTTGAAGAAEERKSKSARAEIVDHQTCLNSLEFHVCYADHTPDQEKGE